MLLCSAQQKMKCPLKKGRFPVADNLLAPISARDTTIEVNMANHSQVITFSMLPKIFLGNQK